MWWWYWKMSFHGAQKYLLLGFHAWMSFSPLDSFVNNGWLGAPLKLKCFCLPVQQALEIVRAFELRYTRISWEMLLNSWLVCVWGGEFFQKWIFFIWLIFYLNGVILSSCRYFQGVLFKLLHCKAFDTCHTLGYFCFLLYPVLRSNMKPRDYMNPKDYRLVFIVVLEISLPLFLRRKSYHFVMQLNTLLIFFHNFLYSLNVDFKMHSLDFFFISYVCLNCLRGIMSCCNF